MEIMLCDINFKLYRTLMHNKVKILLLRYYFHNIFVFTADFDICIFRMTYDIYNDSFIYLTTNNPILLKCIVFQIRSKSVFIPRMNIINIINWPTIIHNLPVDDHIGGEICYIYDDDCILMTQQYACIVFS